MTLICLNLIDGTSVIGKELKSDNRDFIKIQDPLLISSSTYSITGNTQILLTKYNMFSDENFVLFNFYTIISKSKSSKLMEDYYDKFIDKMKFVKTKDISPNTEEVSPLVKPSAKHPFEEKINIEELRKNVLRMDDMTYEVEEDDNEESYQLTLNDDDDDDIDD